jgi:hypothetical protein
MGLPAQDAAAELAAAVEDAVIPVPVTVTIEVDDGSSPPSTMVYGVCPSLVEWTGIENIAADCFEMLSNYLIGRPRSTEDLTS